MSEMQKYDPGAIEKEVLDFWEKNRTYYKAKEMNKGKKQFYYLDGPPYTSGRIHIGHAWGKALRDSIMRYLRMKGLDVWDRSGFDMHGLPTSHKVEAKLGLKSKDEIGVKVSKEEFVKECEKFAMENMHLMIQDFRRLGVWMDWDNPYIPIKPSFIEGNWWLIKKAYENGYLYEGKKVMSWCPSCATSLAKHELDYETVEENSIFVKLKVMVDEKGNSKENENEYIIIWTTTPWTIPFNMAVMINPELDYVRCRIKADKAHERSSGVPKHGFVTKGEKEGKESKDEEKDEVWILAKGLAAPVVQAVADKELDIIDEMKGEELEGIRYRHPFYKEIKFHQEEEERSRKAKEGEQSKRSYTALMSKEYVTLSAGSGIVHCAPGCGPEDYEVGRQYKVPAYNEINEHGMFPENMGKFAGLVAKKDDKKFVEALKHNGNLIAETQVEHEYAHCWRCHSPVVFRATTQWFFDVESDLKDKMIEANKSIKWVPDWAGNRWFDSWLRNLRDNGITRQIVWGPPLPIWRCENENCKHYEVIGSIAELESKAGKGKVPEDLHIPWIDEVKWKCGKCKSNGKENNMKRLPDVLDVWIDAGSACWNCLDYPQRKDLFEKLWPADLILEGKDQIRGWFNLLLVASMVAMKEPSFKAVYMHGFISDFEGKKMSKSLGNVVSPYEVIDKYGSDTLRLYSITAANPGLDMNFNWEDVKQKSRTLTIVWNLHNLLIDLAKTNKINPSKIKPNAGDFGLEEQYILSKLNNTIKKVTNCYESYLIDEAPKYVEELLLELSRTYIQMTRDKAAIGTDEEKKAVIYTIYKVFSESILLLTPTCPFITEKVYQNMRKEFALDGESINLIGWPVCDEKFIDYKIEKDMDAAKEIVTSILNARDKIGLGVRWPLLKATIVYTNNETKEAIDDLSSIIKTQTNVKKIELTNNFKDAKTEVKFNFGKMGPEFGREAPKVIGELSRLSPATMLEKIKKNNTYEVKIAGQKFNIKMDHLIVTKAVPENIHLVESRFGDIYIDKTRNEELDAEGFAREVMRRIQDLRKQAGMKKTDEITLCVKCSEKMKKGLDAWKDQIGEKVGAKDITIKTDAHDKKAYAAHTENSFKIKGEEIAVYFDRI